MSSRYKSIPTVDSDIDDYERRLRLHSAQNAELERAISDRSQSLLIGVVMYFVGFGILLGGAAYYMFTHPQLAPSQ